MDMSCGGMDCAYRIIVSSKGHHGATWQMTGPCGSGLTEAGGSKAFTGVTVD